MHGRWALQSSPSPAHKLGNPASGMIPFPNSLSMSRMSDAWRRRLNGGKIQYLNELVTERQCLREPGFVLISTGKNNFVQIVIVEILLLVID